MDYYKKLRHGASFEGVCGSVSCRVGTPSIDFFLKGREGTEFSQRMGIYWADVWKYALLGGSG